MFYILFLLQALKNYTRYIQCINGSISWQISDEDSFEAQVLQRLTSQEHLNLPHSAVVFHAAKGDTCRDDDSPSYYNRVEIVEVCMYMAKLLAAGVDCDDIGIITPYQKQVDTVLLELGYVGMMVM